MNFTMFGRGYGVSASDPLSLTLIAGIMQMVRLALLLGCSSGSVTFASASQSIAWVWDEQILSAIRIDTPNPPVQARNLFSLSVMMYDAWAVYDTVSVGYLFHEKHTAGDAAAARRKPGRCLAT